MYLPLGDTEPSGPAAQPLNKLNAINTITTRVHMEFPSDYEEVNYPIPRLFGLEWL
ncbi:MAG: hypothetical protein WBQ36_06870 [Desulfobaccales bacterium]